MSIDDESGAYSTSPSSPSSSPRVDVLSSLTASSPLLATTQQEAFPMIPPPMLPFHWVNLMKAHAVKTFMYPNTQQAMFAYQQHQQEMMNQAQLAGMMQFFPTPLSAEMQKMLLETPNQAINPFVSPIMWNLMPHRPIQLLPPPVHQKLPPGRPPKNRDEKPLDLRKKMQRAQKNLWKKDSPQKNQQVVKLEATKQRKIKVEIKTEDSSEIELKPKEAAESSNKVVKKEVMDIETNGEEKQNGTDISTPPSTNGTVTNHKRNYSQVDLTAAVNDIRCGKLGTRRASVVYGIPRSTLRNKIYKLEAAEEACGLQVPYKRRRPGGQSSAEKRLADQVEKAKKAMTPMSNSASLSPDSDSGRESMDTSHCDAVTQEIASSMLAAVFENGSSQLEEDSQPTDQWDDPIPGISFSSNLWNNLFNSQKTQMTPEIMNPMFRGSLSDKELEDWKKSSRPKRGQYRRYDKAALEEAVQSVREGKMSVHRAGSHYGVPHSTLEYKVKERNLMRTTKKKDSPEENLSPVTESPICELQFAETAELHTANLPVN